MSTISNIGKDVRTSDEAAVTPLLADITLGEQLDLEASGELLDPTFLPSADPESASRSRPRSRPDATEVALGVKWGLADYGRIMEERSGLRVTRNAVHTLRSGSASASAAQVVTYRGHRGPRTLESVAPRHETRRLDVSAIVHDPEVFPQLLVETRAEGEGDCEDVRRDGSILEDTDERRDGCLLENAHRNGSPPLDMDVRRDGSLPDESVQRRDGSSGDEEPLDLVAMGTDGSGDGDWKVVHTYYVDPRFVEYMRTTHLIEYMQATTAPRPYPAWFDFNENQDELLPLPDGWPRHQMGEAPMLPDTIYLDANSSFEDEFWRELDTCGHVNDDHNLQCAIAASLATAQDEYEQRQLAEDSEVDVNAIIVEIPDEQPPVDIRPAGYDGHYTMEQKQKQVPRPSQQREFLKSYVGGRPGTQPTPGSGEPPLTSTPRRHHTPASYKRDPSQVPDGQWYGESAGGGQGGGTGGGHGGGRTPPDSSDSSSSDSDSSDSGSDTPLRDAAGSEGDVPGHKHGRKSPSEKRHRKKQKDD
ncbi:hypothetical protein LXA43DRAFT_856899, partial [Ganoderma leucocontextum]